MRVSRPLPERRDQVVDDSKPSGGDMRRPHYEAATPSLLDRYEAIAETSRAMVASAIDEDWPRVRALEQRCLQQVHQLKRASQVETLSPADQTARVQLLRSILADDAEIRRLAEPWLIELEHLLLPPARPAAATE